MKSDGQFDITALDHVKQHCLELEQQHSARNIMFEQQEKLYWMEWDEEPIVKEQIDNVKLTKSPRARNAFQGAFRLLAASDPIISIPKAINNTKAVQNASKIEKFAQAMWFASGRIKGDPIHYDAIRSALLFSEIHIAITSTADLMKYAKGSNPAMEARAEYISERTPYLFDVWNPGSGYPEFGPTGLQAFYRKVSVTNGYVLDSWGKRGADALKLTKGKTDRYSEAVLHDFWDLKQRVVWVDGSEKPILQEDHGLKFIPIVAQLVEGSKLFDKKEKQREPFLYTLNKSGLLDRQNLLLTVIYTMIFGIGANPMWVNYLLDPDNPPVVDFSIPGGQINMRVGERREPLAKQVIDPSLIQGWQISQDLEMESTIYRQTLGEPLGANAPYSMVALLSQGGRLPLTVPQRKASWAIGEAIEIALRWLKSSGTSAYARYEENDIELKPDEIPDHFSISAKLEIALPQDRLNAANTAAVLAAGEDPIVSKEWVRENVLNVGQSDEMTRAIWNEAAAFIQFQKFIYDQMAQLEQQKQMAMQPMGAGGMPGQPTPPPQAPSEGPPTLPQQQPFPEPAEPITPYPPMKPPAMGGI